MILNTQSHNATFFCCLCLAKTSTGYFNGRRHTYVALEQNLTIEPRTSAGFAALAYSASETLVPDHGIKGRCFFENLKNFDIINSNILDYMHGVCIGVFKSLLYLLFFYSSSPFTLSHSLKSLDKDLDDFKSSPSLINPLVKLNKFSFWKAKDFRNYLLYFSPFIQFYSDNMLLNSIISSLRRGIFLLLQENQDSKIFTQVRNDFVSFLTGFSSIFGEHYCTPNFHDLIHLVDCVKMSGPLYEYSGFGFEHLNGRLKYFFKGNKNVGLEVSRKLFAYIENENYLAYNSSTLVRNFLTSKNKKTWKKSHIVSDNSYICGKVKSSTLDYTRFINSYFLKELPVKKICLKMYY